MNPSNLFLAFILLLCGIVSAQTIKDEVKTTIEWEVNGQYRYFYDAPQFENQLKDYPSIGIQPTYSFVWDNGYQNFIASAYFNRGATQRISQGG